MFKRLLITAAATVILGGALVSCGDGGAGSDEPLRWRSAVDVPLNFSMKIDRTQLFPDIKCEELVEENPGLLLIGLNCDISQDSLISFLLEYAPELMPEMTGDDNYLDIDSNTVLTDSDVMDFLRKLDSTEIKYEIWVYNGTKATLTVYGMFFPEDDDAVKAMTKMEYYDIIKDNETNGTRINVLDAAGLYLEPESMGHIKSMPEQSKPLGDLVIRRKAFSYRWLVKFDEMSDAAGATDTVKIRLRIGFSGVNSIDSLFAL